MVYPLQLTTEELERIEAAKSAGINVDTFLKGAIASLPPINRRRRKPAAPKPLPPMPQPRITQPHPLPEYTQEKRQAAIAYLDEQIRKAENATPEELAEGEKELKELLDALDRNRRETGERPLYPE